MDYNRFCEYGFDAANKKHCREFHPNHHSTAYAGAYMIHWWGFAFARTGDMQILNWAKAMTEKYKRVQHPVSGLIPAWFGASRDIIGVDDMPPQSFTNNWDGGTAISYLLGANELKKRPEGEALAKDIEEMAVKLMKGLARYGYDPKSRTFPQWINIDGSPRTETTWYTYHSQEEKDEAVKQDPKLEEVSVFSESGFYEAIRPWILQGGNPLPYQVALAAQMTGDSSLLESAKEFATAIMEEAQKLNGEFNDQGQWIYSANAGYIKMLLLIHEMTGEKKYLDWAQKLADRELDLLSQPVSPNQMPWWKMYFRHTWIEALLLLHKALKASS